jgi:4-amino-4-deoxy-L-arabinose transferase-like glycosyltransferase
MARFSEWIRAHKIELGIFAAAFLVRALYDVLVLLHSGEHGFVAWSDSYYFYYREGMNLIHGHGFSVATAPPYLGDAYHTPLYPLFLAALFFLQVPLFGVALVQAAIVAAMCVLFYRIALTLALGKKVALFTGVAAAFEPMSIFWSGLLMSDTLFAFFLVFAMYFLLEKRMVPASFFAGFAALTRPIGLYFLPVFIIFAAYFTFAEKNNLRATIKNTLLVAVLCAVTVSPWFTRNYVEFGEWGYTATTWYNVYALPLTAFAAEYGIKLVPVFIDDATPTDIVRAYSFRHLPAYRAASLQAIRQNLPEFAVFETLRTAKAIFGSKYDYIPREIVRTEFPDIYTRYLGIVQILANIGDFLWIIAYTLAAAALWDNRLRPWWLFFAGLFLINAILSGMISPGTEMTRYSLPFQGFIFSFACLGATILWDKSRTWRREFGLILR